MSEWIDFERWPECVRMERPGYVFEVRSGDGRIMLTPCTVPLRFPFDWTSAPLRFRLVAERRPRHSIPVPRPQK